MWRKLADTPWTGEGKNAAAAALESFVVGLLTQTENSTRGHTRL